MGRGYRSGQDSKPMVAIDADVLAVADGLGVRLSSQESAGSVALSQAKAFDRARPLAPSRFWICSMSWIHTPERGTRAVWWLVEDDVQWQPTQLSETVRGMAVKAIDAESGDVLVDGVWGRSD